MARDHIDIIGDGGGVIEADDLDTLKRIAQRLRDHVKAFPWAVTQQPEIASWLHVDANKLAEILHNIEANR
jgi:hypothetical protein